MKIMVCGKGGSGKSSVSVLMARALPRKRKVYLIDSDESNVLLPKLLGVKPPKPIVEYLGGKKSIFSKGEVNIVNALAKAGKGIKLDNLPTEYVSASMEGIKLVTIGKVRNFGEGCACPLNFLTKTLLKNLVLNDDEIVLVDTDAGIEHVGRGVEEGCDTILTVVDPTAEALMLAKILKKTFQNLNKKFWLVLNKATPRITEPIKEKAKEMNLEINGVIRFDEEIFESGMEGGLLNAKEALSDMEGVLETIGLT
ncbi:ATP-binding protein [Candidatus Bathyarchaeota archaeon]|nr:ATP-binding protein [Candidatus Bathyarchaeota archaeon]